MRKSLAISRSHGLRMVSQIELGQVLEQCSGLLQIEP